MSDHILRQIQAAIADDGRRYEAIMALPEAKGREDHAHTLFLTSLSLDDIRDCLAAAPQPSAKARADKCLAAAPKPSAQAKSDATLNRIVAGIRARGFGRAQNDAAPTAGAEASGDAITRRVVAGIRARGFGRSQSD